MGFPSDFVWGAAASAYQIEGARQEYGQGLSIWDVFSHQPGRIQNGDTGDVACDHYRRYADDVALMRAIGLQAYRFSVSWPRVIPKGTGAVNQAGLDFYDRLVDNLLDNRITPYVTLFHWDFPYDLYRRGGWKNREVVEWFQDYTRVVVEQLGDRVQHWMTLNEPVVLLNHGYRSGIHAPGEQVSNRDFVYMMHHMLLAHGTAVQVIETITRGHCWTGMANYANSIIPSTNDPALVNLARNEMFDPNDPWSHAWWSDPIVLGQYPRPRYGDVDIPIESGDMDIIHQALKFFGVNLYHGREVYLGDDGISYLSPDPVGRPRTLFHWPITPGIMYWAPKFLYERYRLPILVTENGLSLPDWVALDGQVHDPGRIDFLQRYLREYRRAADDGIPLHGYFHWSLMDNFEWAEGMRQRLGLIHVDFETQTRTLKDSAIWYKDVIATNGANL